ncbi:Stomatal closure-related actin-binding protein 1 [Vitis vinifera]|uniref:Stomatal closure-related actin-binding protein 1 n=1 Tax=Vitis vinifera TaxID=29760 RepID=A0A438BXY5_VITVI|nr:Stomatal closure-related actin-binding protein 1 [Vitis vinifera]
MAVVINTRGNFAEIYHCNKMIWALVVISQTNGQDHPSHSVHVFHVGKMRMKLCKGWITKARESYTASMQIAFKMSQGFVLASKEGHSFVLAFESERDRNAAIMLARRYALECNVMLAGPDDRA